MESALETPFQSFGGDKLYPTIINSITGIRPNMEELDLPPKIISENKNAVIIVSAFHYLIYKPCQPRKLRFLGRGLAPYKKRDNPPRL